MKCHYEVLNLPRDANDDEIKSAYRKLALKWHPDKNLNDQDYAKEQFQFIQQAYEVLSDRQERAWYDAHREQILNGKNSEYEDDSLDLFQYFTTTCFKGYGDDSNGFYATYRAVFEQVAKEDLDYESDSQFEAPTFGDSASDYDTVKTFYNYWSNYSTKKSYSWLDPFDIREAKENRKLLKLIEKENKKVRQAAKKERNEEVRNLVGFIRKRDKRLQAYQKEMEAKRLENQKKQEERIRQKRRERNEKVAQQKQAEWLKFDNVKSELEEIEKRLAEEFGEEFGTSDEDEMDPQIQDSLYCVACNKMFKSSNAFENHESSKKHKENVEKVKEYMLEEEEHDVSVHTKLDEENVKSDCSEDNICLSENDIKLEDIEDTGINNGKPSKKNKNKKKKVMTVPEQDVPVFELSNDLSTDDGNDFSGCRQQRKKSKKKTTNNKVPKEPSIITPIDKSTEMNEIEKKCSKKSKKEKKILRDSSVMEELDINHTCVTCKNSFPSKNKLFEHLKKTNHGIYLSSKLK